ncbi:hypothetical protein ACO0LO_18295 [Undibacterium sp. TJN25]
MARTRPDKAGTRSEQGKTGGISAENAGRAPPGCMMNFAHSPKATMPTYAASYKIVGDPDRKRITFQADHPPSDYELLRIIVKTIHPDEIGVHINAELMKKYAIENIAYEREVPAGQL